MVLKWVSVVRATARYQVKEALKAKGRTPDDHSGRSETQLPYQGLSLIVIIRGGPFLVERRCHA